MQQGTNAKHSHANQHDCCMSSQKLCEDHDIPTAGYKTFTDVQRAQAHLQKHGMPVVIKANGLAAGKGVYVCHTLEEALAAVNDLLVHQKFGKAGTASSASLPRSLKSSHL